MDLVFDGGEAAGEFGDAGVEEFFGAVAEEAADVDDGEEEVAEFIADFKIGNQARSM